MFKKILLGLLLLVSFSVFSQGKPIVDGLKVIPQNAPPSPIKGEIYMDDGSDDMFFWDGLQWVSMGSGLGGGVSWSDPVDANIIPDTDNSYSVGNATFRFSDFYTYTLDVKENIQYTPTDTEPAAILGNTYFDLSEGTLKQYTGSIWEAVGSGLSSYLPLAGGTMTGDIDYNLNDANNIVNIGVRDASNTTTTNINLNDTTKDFFIDPTTLSADMLSFDKSGSNWLWGTNVLATLADIGGGGADELGADGVKGDLTITGGAGLVANLNNDTVGPDEINFNNTPEIGDFLQVQSGLLTALNSTEVRTEINVEDGAAADQNASEVPFTNTTSGYTATDVQAVIDEMGQGEFYDVVDNTKRLELDLSGITTGTTRQLIMANTDIDLSSFPGANITSGSITGGEVQNDGLTLLDLDKEAPVVAGEFLQVGADGQQILSSSAAGVSTDQAFRIANENEFYFNNDITDGVPAANEIERPDGNSEAGFKVFNYADGSETLEVTLDGSESSGQSIIYGTKTDQATINIQGDDSNINLLFDGQDGSFNGIVVDSIGGIATIFKTDVADEYFITGIFEPKTFGGTTVSVAINESLRDAEETDVSGTVVAGSTALELNYKSPDLQYVGMIFTGADLNIPPGSTITNAFIRFQAVVSDSDAVDVDIYGELANAANYTTTNFNITNRTNTVAKVDWDTIEPWTASSVYDSPDISTIIQEIVDDGSYTSAWNIGIEIHPTSGTGHRLAASENHATLTPPTLFVTYQ